MSKTLFIGNEHAQLTPFHLLVLFLGCLSLIVSQWDLPPPLCQAVGVWRRGMVLIVGGMVMHHIVINALRKYQDEAEAAQQRKKEAIDLKAKGNMPKQPNAWENASAHPSAFLTTRDGKPRLFPFPLGKAGAETKELWWEAGNSAHVGHFNQRETPEAREKMRVEMEEKEEQRVKKAKKAIQGMETERKKWQKRLSNLKVVCGIVVVGLIHKTAAVLCLAALIYYVFASELAGILAKPDDEGEVSVVRRKKIPTTPGMAMTYLYEPTADGGVKEAGAIPTHAPSHRLMTTTDNRYAS